MTRKAHLLDSFFNPRSIALFGSMQENWFFGAGLIIGDLLKWSYKRQSTPFIPEPRPFTASGVY